MEYYLFVTNDCNLNCRYCSVMIDTKKNNIPNNPIYSLEELNRFIDKTQQIFKDSVADIIFFGGEPTLKYDFIMEVISSQLTRNNINYEYHYMLHTNGLLLKDIPDTILESLNSIMISINYERIYQEYLFDEYFKSILESVHNIRKRKSIPIVARLTITEKTSLFSEIALLNVFFDAIYWQIENTYQFNDYEHFYTTFKYELELSFQMWFQYLKKGVLIKLIPFISSAHFLIYEHQLNTFCCGYNSSMLYIQTNGLCYTCAEDMMTSKNLIGNIYSEIKFNDFNLDKTKCISCPYLKMCLGRCGRMHREFSISHINEYCSLNKIMFDLIKIHLEDIKHYCKKYNFSLKMDNIIYHYTEYTP